MRVFEMIVKDLELSSGICRTTCQGRLLDVDRLAAPYIAGLHPAQEYLEVHDWAASDALASCEWAQSLFADNPSCRFTASDVTLHLVEVSKGSETYIFEPGGALLQYVRPPFVIQLNRSDSWIFPVNRLLRLRASRKAREFRPMLSRCQWKGLNDPSVFSNGSAAIRLLPLVHPNALAFQRQTPNFRIAAHSALAPLQKPVDVIRTMNIYNIRYFSDSELAQGARSVFQSLVTGGLWIVGRTVDGETTPRNEVSIFKKTGMGFQSVDRLNGGSELEPSLERWDYLGKPSRKDAPGLEPTDENSFDRVRIS